MADNCGACLKLPQKYSCGWCESTSTCEIAVQCSSNGNWLNSTQTCPNLEDSITVSTKTTSGTNSTSAIESMKIIGHIIRQMKELANFGD